VKGAGSSVGPVKARMGSSAIISAIGKADGSADEAPASGTVLEGLGVRLGSDGLMWFAPALDRAFENKGCFMNHLNAVSNRV